MFDDGVATALAYTDQRLREFGYLTETDLTIRCVRGGIATPRVHPTSRTFTGAVHDAGGHLIASSQRHNRGDIVPDDPPLLDADTVERARRHRHGCALYGGILFPILGHFLVESLARLWPLLFVALGERLVCFHTWPGLEEDAFFANPFYLAALKAFGLARENVLLIEQNCSFETLLLPDPASRYHIDMHPLLADLADHITQAAAAPATQSTPHLYLSRSRWSEHVRIDNESAIDDWAESRGFRVVHPQATPPDTLLRLLRQAETVVASDGSHAHLTLFCRPGIRVVMLDTRPVPTQFALARLRGFRTMHLPLCQALGFDAQQRLVDPRRLGPLIDAALAQLYG